MLRVPTDSGTVGFKANMDELRQEAAIAELVSSRRPDVVLPPLAIDRETDMLLPDAGENLRVVVERERSLERWVDVLGRSGALQVNLMDSRDQLLAAGAPDIGLTTLRRGFESLLEQVDDPRPQLADAGLPSTSWRSGSPASASPTRSSTTTCMTR